MAKQAAAKRTKAPCPGCGETPGYLFRDADKVCGECRRELDRAKQILEDSARGRERVNMPHAYYGLPYISNANPRGHDREPLKKFQIALVDAARAVGIACEPDWENCSSLVTKQDSGGGYGTRGFLALPDGFRDAANRLYRAADAMVQAAYKNGFADGRQLIAGLADGSVSIDKYNRLTIGKDEEE
jgi:hypothetical protein